VVPSAALNPFVLVLDAFGVCSGRSRSFYGAVSLRVSLWWRAQFVVRGNRGLLPVSTSVFLSALPGAHPIFIAETGGDMTQLPTPGHLASWAGVSPGSNESAGRVKSTARSAAAVYDSVWS
jgi:hypothetical protein